MFVNGINFIARPTQVSFSGVNFHDFADRLKNLVGSNTSTGFAEPNDRFEKGHKEIIETSRAKKKAVQGLFKKKQIEKIQEEEDNKLRGYLKAQEIFVDEQDKVIAMAKSVLQLAQMNNSSQDEIAKLNRAYLQALKVKEKNEIIANNKNKDKGFDSIGGYEYEKFVLTDNFINLLPLEMSGENVEFPNSILFFGPLGNGKTSFAQAFAYSADCLFDEAKPKSASRNRQMREKSFYDDLINKAEIAQQNFQDKGVRTIILVDEIDRISRDDSSILPKLKKFLETCSQDYHVTVFATTNNPLEINSAIRGPKRMPVKVSIDPPNEANAAEVFAYYLKHLPENIIDKNNIDLSELAQEICSVQPARAYNNSQIETICKTCCEETDGVVTQKDLLYYIKKDEPGISKENLDKFRNEKTQLIGIDND